MRTLVIGKTGQLANELAQVGQASGWDLHCAGRPEIDVNDIETIIKIADEYCPNAIINTAAYTAVDKAESEQEKAFAVNMTGAGNVAKVAQSLAIPCLHFSTDYVFNGQLSRPYREDDTVEPMSIYGQSKEAGERAVRDETDQHIILRTSWVYSPYHINFVKTMIELMSVKQEINVIKDQTGSPTSARDLALAVKKIISNLNEEKELYGTYHISGSGITNWFEFAMNIQKITGSLLNDSWPGRQCKIMPIATSEYQCTAQRPVYSVLDNSKLTAVFGLKLPSWKESLIDCIKRIYPDGDIKV